MPGTTATDVQNPPAVSVVIPCFNVEELVSAAVDSVLAQTHPVPEIICVDDGSTDGTLAVLRAYERDHERVKVLTGENGGGAVARNRGLRAASGEYVQFLDSDDVLDPTKLEHQLGLVERESSPPAVIIASHRQISLGGEVTLSSPVRHPHPDPWVSLLTGRFGITSANLYRRTSVEEVGAWSPRMPSSDDAELGFRLLQHGARVIVDDQPLTLLRRRPGSVWYGNPARDADWLALRRDMIQWLRAHHEYTAERRRAAEILLLHKLRGVYAKDPELAVAFHDETILPGFRPPRSEVGAIYGRLYRTLGFRWAQRLHPVLDRIADLLLPLMRPQRAT